MLKKLLKYDLQWSYKVVVIYYALGIGAALIGRGFNSIENSTLFSVLGKFTCGFAVAMLISSLFNCVLREWHRFIQNIYKDESYLTHTLPVTKNQIYISKVLASVITCFTTVVVIMIGLFICYYSESNIEWIKNSLKMAADVYDVTVVGILVCLFGIFFLEVLFLLMIGYAGIVIGHRFNKNKMLLSVLIAVAFYMISNAISVGGVIIVGLMNESVMNLINTKEAIGIDAIKFIIALGMIVYGVYDVIFYLIGKWQLNKGVNVD